MFAKVLAAAALSLVPLLQAAAAETVDYRKSQISFGFKQENVPGDGEFRRFSAAIAFDAAKPEATKANLDIDLTSIDIGDPAWNRDIQGGSWFDTKKFPKASVVVTTAKALGSGRFEAPAKLTLKGSTRDAVLKFTAKSSGPVTVIEGTVPLDRTDYRIGEGTWADTNIVANEVVVRFRIHLQR